MDGPFGKVDGFVKVHANGKYLCETNVVKKDFNPVWNYACPPIQLDIYGPGLKLEIFDWDAAGSNDRIGKFMIKSMLHLLEMIGNHLLCASDVVIYDLVANIPHKKGPIALALRFEIVWPVALHGLPPPMKISFLEKIRSNKVFGVLQKWGINPLFMVDLLSLTTYDFVLVLDDSGSMQSKTSGSKTRWMELMEG